MYKILVVDDDYEILKLMRTILEMKNYKVTTYQEVTLIKLLLLLSLLVLKILKTTLLKD